MAKAADSAQLFDEYSSNVFIEEMLRRVGEVNYEIEFEGYLVQTEEQRIGHALYIMTIGD